MTMMRSVVLGCGSYLPSRVLTNAELAKTVDTSDEWIVQRTGIRERHIAATGEVTSDLGASRRAGGARRTPKIDAQSIDLIVLATSTPDNTFPASAVSVQAGLGITHGAAFDLQAVCSGFVYALATADGLLRTGALQARAGDRRRNLLAHPRLEGPRAPACCSATARARSCSKPRSSRARARIAAS